MEGALKFKTLYILTEKAYNKMLGFKYQGSVFWHKSTCTQLKPTCIQLKSTCILLSVCEYYIKHGFLKCPVGLSF